MSDSMCRWCSPMVDCDLWALWETGRSFLSSYTATASCLPVFWIGLLGGLLLNIDVYGLRGRPTWLRCTGPIWESARLEMDGSSDGGAHHSQVRPGPVWVAR